MKKLIYILLLMPLDIIGQSYSELAEEITIYIDLSAGWNLIGYTCQIERDAIDVFNSIEDEIIILKNNDGSVYMPEFGFNGVGNLIPGYGYQLKIENTILNFSLNNSCLFGCMSSWADNFYEGALIDDGSCYLYGCSSEWADNFDSNVTIDDGSCFKYGCMNTLYANYDMAATIHDSSLCQTFESLFESCTTSGNTMTVGFSAPILDQFEGGLIGAFHDTNNDGLLENVIYNGPQEILSSFFAVGIVGDSWGDACGAELGNNGFPQLLESGESPKIWLILHDDNVIIINNLYEFEGFSANGINIITDPSLSLAVECNDPNALNYLNVNYTDIEVIDLGICEY